MGGRKRWCRCRKRSSFPSIAIREHRDAMADSVPFADQYAARRDLNGGRLARCLPMEAVVRGPLEQAAGGGFEAAENSFLQSVGDGLKQKSPADVDRRFGAVEHSPALLEGGGVEPAEFGELVRQASSP